MLPLSLIWNSREKRTVIFQVKPLDIQKITLRERTLGSGINWHYHTQSLRIQLSHLAFAEILIYPHRTRDLCSWDTYKNWSHSLSCPPFVLGCLEDKFSLAWLLLWVMCCWQCLKVPLSVQSNIRMKTVKVFNSVTLFRGINWIPTVIQRPLIKNILINSEHFTTKKKRIKRIGLL